ncbi:MAG: hypothetical protein WD025_00390 [Bacteriovoracaceae bacterium]
MKHFVFAVVLSIFLPMAVDFAVSVIKLANRSPLQNMVPFANANYLKSYLRGLFWNRQEIGFEGFILRGFCASANLFIFSYTVSVFDNLGAKDSTENLLFCLMIYSSLILFIRLFYLLAESERLNWSSYLDLAFFSFTSMILFFTGLSLIESAIDLEAADILIFIFSQALIFTFFKKLYALGENSSHYERHVAINTRLGLNFLLLSFFFMKGWENLKLEALAFVVLGAVALEILMSLLKFEIISVSSNLIKRHLEKYINVGLTVALAARILF